MFADSGATGPRPGFVDPIHVGRPNIADPELFLQLTKEALDRRWLSNDGPLVREFEAKIASYLGVKHCVAVVNGTVGLEIAMSAAQLTGEVIVPSWTFVATPHAVRWLGLTPVFADVDPVTHCLDPKSVESKITDRTSAILGVHLWGRAAPVEELQELATRYDLTLLFDAAHAFGVGVAGKMIGNFGRAEVMSFHATKFFNAIEGGAIVTNDDDLASSARLMRNFGFAGEDRVVEEGTNGKMSEISAAMGLANMGGLDELIAINRLNYLEYRDRIDRLPGLHVLPINEVEPTNYQYVLVIVDDDCPLSRDDLLAVLRSHNVLARRYFWPGSHRMEPYASLEPDAGMSLPVTEALAGQVIVLPTGSAVSVEVARAIVAIIEEALAK